MAIPTTWTLESYFPEFDGAEHRAFLAALEQDLAHEIVASSALAPLDANNTSAWVERFLVWETLGARLEHLTSYLECLGAADAANEAYQSAEAALASLSAEFDKLETQVRRGFRDANDTAWASLLADHRMADAAHVATRLRETAQFQMDAAAEALASDLGIDSISAWGRLYDTVSGKMSFPMTWPDGRTEDVPMSQRRSLLTDADRSVRATAFREGNKVWAAAEDTMAAALNALAGTRLTLYSRRGQNHFLEAPLQDSAVSRETLDAMFTAIAANYETPRRILRLNAQLQGTPALAWYDQDAPQLPNPLPPLNWPRAVELVRSSFGSAYPKLHDYFNSMIEHRWIESEKRPHKRAGAFATGSPLTREERIYMTFGGTMSDVTTLAHEAGHTWHSHLLTAQRPCARDYPMTLAETASTFAENILSGGLLGQPDLAPDQRAFLIEQSVSHTPGYLLNLPVRFLFETRFYEERRSGTVPVSRIKKLMVEAQREVFGDTLTEGEEDPWFWASKLHFFISDLSFYNFPYTFGFLLSQALYQEFQREGEAFLPRYETFLGLTGRATCEDVVQQSLGRDLRDPAFWAEAIRGLEPKIADYAEIVAERTGGK